MLNQRREYIYYVQRGEYGGWQLIKSYYDPIEKLHHPKLIRGGLSCDEAVEQLAIHRNQQPQEPSDV